MSELRPPPRWLSDAADDVPPAFSEAARGYHADAPSAGERARMWEKLEHSVAPVASSWSVGWLKLGALLVLGAGTGLVYIGTRGVEHPQPTAATLADREPGPALDTPAQPAIATSAQAAIDAPAQTAIDAPAQAAIDTPAQTAIDAPAQAVIATPEPKPARAPGSAARKAPKPHDVVRSAAHAGTQESPDDRPAAPTSSGKGDEVNLLVRARKLLHAEPARALELTQQHSHAFPHGVFAEERELLAIEALSQLGQHQLAEQRSTQFLRAYPSSAHRRRIVALRSAE